MIRVAAVRVGWMWSKPRASGDDPQARVSIAALEA